MVIKLIKLNNIEITLVFSQLFDGLVVEPKKNQILYNFVVVVVEIC
jgi:hypothetical protein